MTAVAGRRMAETVARRGGLAVIPQDIPIDVVAEVVGLGQAARTWCTTPPITLGADRHRRATRSTLLPKRAHGAVVVVDGRPAGRRGHRGRLRRRRPVHPAVRR